MIFSTLLLLDARKVRVAGIQGGSTTSAEACARVEEMLYERPRRPSRYGRRVRLTARLPRARTRQRFFNEETFFEFSPGGPTFNLGVRCCSVLVYEPSIPSMSDTGYVTFTGQRGFRIPQAWSVVTRAGVQTFKRSNFKGVGSMIPKVLSNCRAMAMDTY